MATLPTGGEIAGNFVIEQQPSLTWYLDRDTGRIQGTADGLDAVKQAVDIILHVERFRWQIFRSSSGMDWKGLIGQDPGYVAAELQRRLWDALRMDDRVLSVKDFQYELSGDTLTAAFTVVSTFGETQGQMEVTVA